MATNVFVSYAWGDDFEAKEWLRGRVIPHLELLHSVFWDRDAMGPGQDVFELIRGFLSQRPLWVLCAVDSDYVEAAKRSTSGVARELRLLKNLRNAKGARVIPLLMEKGLAGQLPSALKGLVYADLSELHSHGLHLGPVLLDLIDGASQAQILARTREQLESWALRSRLRSYLGSCAQGTFTGHPMTREVTYDHRELVVAPSWMHKDIAWQPVASEKNDRDFFPAKGLWHWDHWTPSLGMRALAVAIADKCFASAAEHGLTQELETIGNQLALDNISMTKISETLLVTSGDMERACMRNVQTRAAAKTLLDAMGV